MLLDESGLANEANLGWLDANKELRMEHRVVGELPDSTLKKAIERTVQSSNRIVLTNAADPAATASPRKAISLGWSILAHGRDVSAIRSRSNARGALRGGAQCARFL